MQRGVAAAPRIKLTPADREGRQPVLPAPAQKPSRNSVRLESASRDTQRIARASQFHLLSGTDEHFMMGHAWSMRETMRPGQMRE
jgi:hypothetical protein